MRQYEPLDDLRYHSLAPASTHVSERRSRVARRSKPVDSDSLLGSRRVGAFILPRVLVSASLAKGARRYSTRMFELLAIPERRIMGLFLFFVVRH